MHGKRGDSVEGGGETWENRGGLKSSWDAQREETLKMTQFITITATKEREGGKMEGRGCKKRARVCTAIHQQDQGKCMKRLFKNIRGFWGKIKEDGKSELFLRTQKKSHLLYGCFHLVYACAIGQGTGNQYVTP